MQNEESGFGAQALSMLLYVAIGLVITLMTALILALLISQGTVGEALGGALAAYCCVPGAGVAAFFSARRFGRRRLPVGLGAGLLFFLILVLIGAICLPGFLPKQNFWSVFVACIAGGALGAFASTIGKK